MPTDSNRRNFMKATGALGAAATLAGCVGGNGDSGGDGGGGDGGGGGGDGGGGDGGGGDGGGADSGSRPVKMLTISAFAYDPQKAKYEETYGNTLERNMVAQATTQQLINTGGNEEYDIFAHGPSIAGDVTFQDPPLTQSVPTDALDKWTNENITDLFTNPSERIPEIGNQAEEIEKLIWGEDGDRSELNHPPFQFNLDAMASNPKFVDEDISKWGAMFDDQYSGRSVIQTTTPHSLLETLSYLMDTGVMDEDLSNLNQPTKDQIDTGIDFLIKQKQEGQFRSLWTQYGESVNLFTNEEAYVGDLWQPAVFTARRAGTPVKYHTMSSGIQGYRFWWGGVNPTNPGASNRNNVDEAHQWLNMHLGAWYPGFIQGAAGFYTPQYPNEELVRDGSDETGQGMGPEFYDWTVNGEATYEAVDDPNLFDPSSYEWSMEEGEASSDGKVRDGGALDDKVSSIRMVQIYPDNGDYMLNRWTEFTGA